MRLVKLTLAGFKSFADKTEFTFDSPITGIVGPNGCGKSNVVDALKWVLGERSSKSLRGTEMIDVIFAGSASRKQMGMASVTLTFENPLMDSAAATIAFAAGLAAGVSSPLIDAETTELVQQAVAETSPKAASVELVPHVHDEVPLTNGSGDGHAATENELPLEQAAQAEVEAEAQVEVPEDDRRSPMFMSRDSTRRRGLPIDSDIVEVERRLYRDGVSDYLINGKKARLKDIRDLFLDTGVGADAYCIIEQGKVDAMLLASPMERRTIFEEAAGVAKFRIRKAEAERKLERTDTNLIRAREQLESTDRRLRMVKGQAEKARKFRTLDEDYKALKMALLLDQYHGVVTTLADLTGQLQKLESGRTESQTGVATLEAQRQEAELVRHELADRKRRAESELQNARHAEESATQRGRAAERASEATRRQLENDQTQMVETDGRIGDMQTQMEHAAEQVAALNEEQALAEVALNNLGTQKGAILERAAEQRSEMSRKRVTVGNIDRERAGLLAAVEQDQRRASVLHDQVARLKQKAEFSGRDGEQVAHRKAQLQQAVTALRSQQAELEAKLTELTGQSGHLSAERRAVADKLGELEQAVARTDARRAALQEMVSQRVGLDEAVRDVLSKKQAGKAFAGVVGVLADLVDASRADAATVETAMGEYLQALVVPSLHDAVSADELATLAGTVAFVPLVGSTIDAEREALFAAAIAELPLVKPARPLVQARAAAPGAGAAKADTEAAQTILSTEISGLLDRLLGRTLLVRDLDAAMMLAAGPLADFVTDRRGIRFVTEFGAILETDGRLMAGQKGSVNDNGAGNTGGSMGVLERRAELESLQVQLAEHTAARDTLRQQVRSLDSEAAGIAEALGQTRKETEQVRRQLAGDESRLEQAGRDADRLARESKGLADEITALVQRGEALEAEREALIARAAQLQRLLVDEQAAAEAVEQKIAEVQAEADGLSEQITRARINVMRVSEQLSASRRERQRLEWSLEEQKKRSAQLGQAVKGRQAALVEHNSTVAESAKVANEARNAAEALAEQMTSVAAELTTAVSGSGALGEQLLIAREQAGQIEQQWHRLEISKREAEIKRENMEGRAADELGSQMNSLYTEYRDLMAETDATRKAMAALAAAASITAAAEDDAEVERVTTEPVLIAAIDHALAASEIEELRREIKKLGNVNLDSIEEETQLAGRNEDLATQVTDLDTASKQLVELIEKLKEASRERFRTTFGTIQEHFAGDGGMFRKLFGGGKAEVKLMSVVRDGVDTGETDWLESGIEIIARPPGKQPRSISQLSGGEKSMTAVALLMAIFRSKPSCFCVLDEVDAALDDANVDRFCRVVQEFTTMSSFIVITHHKRTMHQADQLFGVTMQERGVSKRVSVRIDQVGADGSIKELPAGETVPATTKAAAATASKPGQPGKQGKTGKSGHGDRHGQTPSDKDPNNLAPMGTGKLLEDEPAEPSGQQIKVALGAMVKGESLEVVSQ